MQELSRRPLNSPLAKSHSEADLAEYDQTTGRRRRISRTLSQANKEAQFLQDSPQYSPMATMADSILDNGPTTELAQSVSMSSQTTASPKFEEVRTPPNSQIDSMIAPLNICSPWDHATSHEESSAWPRARRQSSLSKPIMSSLERVNSTHQGRRHSHRSTSSSLSPASAFLSKWMGEEATPEPDDEGQEIGDYVLGKKVGFGGFSIVREAYTMSGSERTSHAVKIVRKQIYNREELENDRVQSDFEHEVNLWRCLSHRNILPLLSVYITDFATFAFTRLHRGGTLFELARSERQGLPFHLARRYAYQLASAIRYLHEDVRVVHGDIKLENCLIDLSPPDSATRGGNLLLCDFGLAEFYHGDSRSSSPTRPSSDGADPSATSVSAAGSLQYASPELIDSPVRLLSPAVDVWAFGVVVYALVAGTLPFPHTWEPRVRMDILAGDWDRGAIGRAKGGGEEVQEMVTGCLEMNVDGRWDIGTCLACAWLSGCEEMMVEGREDWAAG